MKKTTSLSRVRPGPRGFKYDHFEQVRQTRNHQVGNNIKRFIFLRAGTMRKNRKGGFKRRGHAISAPAQADIMITAQDLVVVFHGVYALQLRMDHRNMVALHEVFDCEFPVCIDVQCNIIIRAGA